MTELSAALLRAAALIDRLQDHGLLCERTWTIGRHPDSPWLTVDAVAAEPFDCARVRPYRFAVWGATGDLYAVGPDGAIGDNPIAIGDVDVGP